MSEELSREELVAAVGAVIFASGEPVSAKEIATAFDGVEVAEIKEAIESLNALYGEGRGGLRVEYIAGGYRLATEQRVGAWVRRFFRQRNRTRLSPAALETLAIVAYKQPVTGPEIQAIRGKDPGAGLKSLLDKKMIRILGKKKVVGSPLLYGTSKQFLIHFGLSSLRELPSIDEFDEFVSVLESGQAKMFDAEQGVEIEAMEAGEAEVLSAGGDAPDEEAAAVAAAQQAGDQVEEVDEPTETSDDLAADPSAVAAADGTDEAESESPDRVAEAGADEPPPPKSAPTGPAVPLGRVIGTPADLKPVRVDPDREQDH